MATEIELKLNIFPDDVPAFESCSLLVGAEGPVIKNYGNTYFDTANLQLNKRKIALRIRDTGNGRLQTVKCAADSINGLSARPEWETVYQDRFDFSKIDAPQVRLFLDSVANELIPLFTTNFTRKTWKVVLPEGTEVLVMLDVGEVAALEKQAPLSEVELELAKGSTDELVSFSHQLRQHATLSPSDVSKAERGFSLLGIG